MEAMLAASGLLDSSCESARSCRSYRQTQIAGQARASIASRTIAMSALLPDIDEIEAELEELGFAARPRRPRHLVQLRPLAALARSAGPNKTPELTVLLSDQRAGDEPRHHHALGGPHGDRRPLQLQAGAVPRMSTSIRRCSTASARRCPRSKGNGIDPLDIIDRYGTDALRFVMVHAGHRDAGQPDAGVECLSALRYAGAGQARAHVHADAKKLDVPELQEAVSAGRSLAERTIRS